MPRKTTKDILERAQRFHHRIKEFYDQLSDVVEKEKLKVLLKYMSRHETQLEQALAKIEEETDPSILNKPFQITPDHIVTRLPHPSRIQSDISVDDVLEISLEMDEQIIELYRFMAENTFTQEIRDFFTHLIEMEEEEELNVVRDSLTIKSF